VNKILHISKEKRGPFSVEDLIKEYKLTLKKIRKQKVELKTRIQHLSSYLQRNVDSDEAFKEMDVLKAECKTYSEIEGDLQFALEWMMNGKMPGLIRGIERRSVYQNTKLMDPLDMQRYFRSNENPYEWDKEEKEHVITLTDKEKIEKLLSVLTDTEREVFLMKKGNALSLDKIAYEWGISKQTVSKTLKRAEAKMAKHVENLKELGQWNLYSL